MLLASSCQGKRESVCESREMCIVRHKNCNVRLAISSAMASRLNNRLGRYCRSLLPDTTRDSIRLSSPFVARASGPGETGIHSALLSVVLHFDVPIRRCRQAILHEHLFHPTSSTGEADLPFQAGYLVANRREPHLVMAGLAVVVPRLERPDITLALRNLGPCRLDPVLDAAARLTLRPAHSLLPYPRVPRLGPVEQRGPPVQHEEHRVRAVLRVDGEDLVRGHHGHVPEGEPRVLHLGHGHGALRGQELVEGGAREHEGGEVFLFLEEVVKLAVEEGAELAAVALQLGVGLAAG